jgi:hypothetical protein
MTCDGNFLLSVIIETPLHKRITCAGAILIIIDIVILDHPHSNHDHQNIIRPIQSVIIIVIVINPQIIVIILIADLDYINYIIIIGYQLPSQFCDITSIDSSRYSVFVVRKNAS